MVGWVENHLGNPTVSSIRKSVFRVLSRTNVHLGGAPFHFAKFLWTFLGGKEVSLFPSLKERGRKSDHQFTLLAIPNMHLSGFSVGPVSGISAMWQSPPGGRRPRECLQLERCQPPGACPAATVARAPSSPSCQDMVWCPS